MNRYNYSWYQKKPFWSKGSSMDYTLDLPHPGCQPVTNQGLAWTSPVAKHVKFVILVVGGLILTMPTLTPWN